MTKQEAQELLEAVQSPIGDARLLDSNNLEKLLLEDNNTMVRESLQRVINALRPEQYPIRAKGDGETILEMPDYLREAIDILERTK